MLKLFQRKNATNRLIEEKLYAQVLSEMENGEIRAGLWAKSLANSGGGEEKAKGLYIKYRVQSIKDEYTITEEYFEIKEKNRSSKSIEPCNANEIDENTEIKKNLSINDDYKAVDEDYYSLECFAKDTGFSIDYCKNVVEKGGYASKIINGKLCIHKSELSKESLKKYFY